MTKKNLLKLRRACGLSNLPWLLATCSYQEVLLQQVQATLTWNKNCCPLELNHGLHVKLLTKLWFCRKLSGRGSWDSLGCFCISIDIMNYTLYTLYIYIYLYPIPYVNTQKCNIVSVQTFGAKENIPTLYNKCQKEVDDNPPFNLINRNLVIHLE